MSKDLQEQFKSHVFEDVKENLYRIHKDIPRYQYCGDNKKHNKYLRDYLIELRREYARNIAQGVPLLQICPSPKDLYRWLQKFIEAEVEKAIEEVTDDFKPMAIRWVRRNKGLIEHLQEEFRRSAKDINRPHPMGLVKYLIAEWLRDEYGNAPNNFLPDFHAIAKSIVYEIFTSQLVLDTDSVEPIKEGA
ncbi:hypothetical protein C0030_005945 [Candidatus Liberibacter solanacearum]|uniref:Uncharacterized protein n=1 Tax=Candidatus Liberibacter solanacearum TaxID=556287 RepID=A0A3R7R8U5_9HYPH|nr:hypothetical protein [Candidatus Liberibacter solanacearum]RPD36774.1 hypothetical protein C0030_005945 [Candidatus Liberibacter solanacearum]